LTASIVSNVTLWNWPKLTVPLPNGLLKPTSLKLNKPELLKTAFPPESLKDEVPAFTEKFVPEKVAAFNPPL
jgi:hypothetical protein